MKRSFLFGEYTYKKGKILLGTAASVVVIVASIIFARAMKISKDSNEEMMREIFLFLQPETFGLLAIVAVLCVAIFGISGMHMLYRSYDSPHRISLQASELSDFLVSIFHSDVQREARDALQEFFRSSGAPADEVSRSAKVVILGIDGSLRPLEECRKESKKVIEKEWNRLKEKADTLESARA